MINARHLFYGMFFVTLLNHAYRVCGATLGGLAGTIVNFKLKHFKKFCDN